MSRRLIILFILSAICSFLTVGIGTAEPVFDPGSLIQFAGRQAVYADGDTLMLCFIGYTGTFPDLAHNNQPKNLIFKRSFDGGQTFQTGLTRAGDYDGLPTLMKDGQEIILTASDRGYIIRMISQDNGVSFLELAPVQGSDRLPISDKYDGQYHSCYMYQDMCAEHGRLEGSSTGFYGNFCDVNRTTNDTIIKYWGPDVLYGPVRSNSDIYIQQLGGGNNNGWPTFYDPVVTSGEIEVLGGTPNYEQVFRKGCWENVPTVPFQYTLIPMYAQVVGPAVNDPNRIMMVTVNGASYISWIGLVVEVDIDTLDVWTQYPPRNGVWLFRNWVTRKDTLWTPGPTGSTQSGTFMVNCPLWIKGQFSGKQTWYSPYDIYIMDNITLTGTPVGQAPDGTEPGSSYNSNDMVALVSGRSIYVQYGYRDPQDSLRYKPNCGSDADGVWIYASLYALGDGNGDSHRDGVFTFEYQHPHPSVPAVILAGNPYVWDKIDLHRRHYPQTENYPWPPNIDYPWYNPLWPESSPTLERGTVHIYGSIIQRRRGFLHRSLSDSEHPNPAGVWDIEEDLCGGPAGNSYTDPVLDVTYYCSNAPGATGAGVGYKKDYHYDYRINGDTFGFNTWGFGIRLETSSNLNDWQLVTARDGNPGLVAKAYERKFGQILFSLNNRLFRYQNSELTELTHYLNTRGNITQINLLDAGHALIQMHDRNIGHAIPPVQTPDTLHVFILDLNNHNILQLANYEVPTEMNDIAFLDNGLKLIVQAASATEVQFKALNQDNELVQLYNWNPGQDLLNSDDHEFSRARLHLIPSGSDSLYAFIWLPLKVPYNPALPFLTNGVLFCARGALANTGIQEETIQPDPIQNLRMSFSPNPFSAEAKVSFYLPRATFASVNVYNLKGQLVKNLTGKTMEKGEHTLSWNGTDDRQKQLPSGIYLIRLEDRGFSLTKKVFLLN